MRKTMFISLLSALLVCIGCERRPFMEHSTEINLQLEINMKIQSSIVIPGGGEEIPEPELVRVCLCNPETGAIEYEDYLGPKGGYIYPTPGVYDILVYNFNTESTIIEDEQNLYTARATTGEISQFIKTELKGFLEARATARQEAAQKGEGKGDIEMDEIESDEKIVNEPDHLFVGRRDNVVIPALEPGESRNLVIEMNAETIVEVWDVKLSNVKGTEWVSKVSALMTGMVESTNLYDKKDSDRPVTLFFGMRVGEDKKSLVASFRTFGKNPLFENKLEVDLNITDVSGNEHRHHFNVTDQFNEDNKEHLIIVEQPVEIEKPTGGGFAPSVEDWEDIETDIII